jgi:mannitol/fructose-specific phosphotransferase system IIA component (Ntr-type)
MDTLLDALQEGRLFELPENDKTHALQFLAHIIEAFPEIPAGTDIVELVMSKEKSTNTGIGKGWSSPHAGVPFDEDLMCVVGWSPTGIDYGAKDGQPVKLVVMYLVPANQRHHYLREISMLAKAVETGSYKDKLDSANDLNDVRNYLLDMVTATKETVGPDTRARMIRLQTKAAIEPLPMQDLSNLIVEPVTLVTGAGFRPIALSQSADLTDWLDNAQGLVEKLELEGMFQHKGWRLLRRNTVAYEGGRSVYDCLAIKIARGRRNGE